MSLKRFLCLGALVLLGARIAFSDDSAQKFHPPPATMHAVLAALEERMPPGWSVNFDQESNVIEIKRDHEILAENTTPNQGADQKDVRIKFSLDLRVVPFLSRDEWRRLKAGNRQTEVKVTALFGELSNHLPHMGDDFEATDEASKKKIAEYEKLKSELHNLPELYFRDVSLEWLPNDPNVWGFYPYAPADDAILRECKDVVKKIEAGLSTY